jgi:hypothetical protein
MRSRPYFYNLGDYKGSDLTLNGRSWAQVTNGSFPPKAAVSDAVCIQRQALTVLAEQTRITLPKSRHS